MICYFCRLFKKKQIEKRQDLRKWISTFLKDFCLYLINFFLGKTEQLPMFVFPIVRHGYYAVLLGAAMATSFFIEFKHH